MQLQVNIFYILLGLCIGLFIIHVLNKDPRVIVKYPSIDTIEQTTYVDNQGKCFKYYAIKQ